MYAGNSIRRLYNFTKSIKLGSIIALSNENKEIVERYSYDVFGEPNTTSTIGNPYLFTGRRYDNETALYYYRARYYDYYLGRFIQADPIGYDDGLNLYTYCENNPLTFADPSGLCKAGDLDRQKYERYVAYIQGAEQLIIQNIDALKKLRADIEWAHNYYYGILVVDTGLSVVTAELVGQAPPYISVSVLQR